MFDIENVDGIIIAPDASFKSFGIYADNMGVIGSDDWDSSFKKEIVSDEWFKKLEKDLAFEYNDDGIKRQGGEWASDGIILMIHEYDAYLVYAPSFMTIKQRHLFKKNYDNLVQQIDNSNASFQVTLFDENGNYADDGMIFGLDNFYDRMHISRNKEVSRVL